MPEEDLQEKIQSFDYCFNTSAKTGDNVELMFEQLAKHFLGDKT